MVVVALVASLMAEEDAVAKNTASLCAGWSPTVEAIFTCPEPEPDLSCVARRAK